MTGIRRRITIMMLFAIVFTVGFTMSTENSFAAVKTPGKVPSVKVAKTTFNTVTVKWGKTKKAKKYVVYMASSKNGKYKKVKTLSKRTCTVGKLQTGKKYWFKVRAINGKKKGKYSKKVSGKPMLAKPSIVIYGGKKGLIIEAKKVAGANGYIFYRDGEVIRTQASNRHEDTGAEIDVDYTYEVKAYRTVKGKKVTSKASTPQTECWDGTATPPPTDTVSTPSVKVSSITETSVALSWTCSSGADSYIVYRNNSKIATVTKKSYTDSGLSAGTTYKYKVTAKKGTASATSSVISVTTKTAAAEEVYLDYSANGGSTKTRIKLGMSWTNTLKNNLSRNSSGQDSASRPGYFYDREADTFSDSTFYYFDVGDYDNFLEVEVVGGKIVRWETCGQVIAQTNTKAVYRGDDADNLCIPEPAQVAIVQNTLVKEYIPYIKVNGVILGGAGVQNRGYGSSKLILAEEQKVALHQTNFLRALAGKGVLELNSYLCGDGKTYGAQAWAETMNASGICGHGIDKPLPKGPLAGKLVAEREDDIWYASGKTVVLADISGENCAYGGATADHAVGTFLDTGHIHTLMDDTATLFGFGLSGKYICCQYGYYW